MEIKSKLSRTCEERNSIRRRLAAVNFLSNISLDGSHQDTKIAPFIAKKLPKNDKSPRHTPKLTCKTDVTDDAGYGLSDSENVEATIKMKKKRNGHTRYHSTSDSKLTNESEADDTFSSRLTTFRERTNTTGSTVSNIEHREKPECELGHKSGGRKRISHQYSVGSDNEKTTTASSNESLSYDRTVVKTAYRVLEGKKRKQLKPSGKNSKFLEERLVLATSNTYVPFVVFTANSNAKTSRPTLVRADHHKESTRRRLPSTSRPLSSISDGLDPFELLGLERYKDEDTSYSEFLVPSKHFQEVKSCLLDDNVEKSAGKHVRISTSHNIVHNPQPSPEDDPLMTSDDENIDEPKRYPIDYHSFLLDDPELVAERHRANSNLPSYMSSLIDYVKPEDLKKELNDKFRERFPKIQLTLSKLRSIKREMKKIMKNECGDYDFITISYAYVYYEKLILRHVINKANRKLCAGACLMLAAKLNDYKGDSMKSLIERTENIFRLNHRDLLGVEFAVLVALEFALHIPLDEILPHYQRLVAES